MYIAHYHFQMNRKAILLSFIFSLFSLFALAQREKMSREDKQERNEARMSRINAKNDYALFRKQMLALKEYGEERKKIPALQKASKTTVKVITVIDSNDNDEDSKTLVGYIRQDVGDNSTNMYEVTYDRSSKKIVSVKRTPEAQDADKEEMEEKAETKEKTKTVHRKNKDEDDDEDMDEDRPVKTKHKEKDED